MWFLRDVSTHVVLESFITHDNFDRWSYSSILAYIVDANRGRSSTAVATNSAFRGFSAFVATEVAVPMQVQHILFRYHL